MITQFEKKTELRHHVSNSTNLTENTACSFVEPENLAPTYDNEQMFTTSVHEIAIQSKNKTHASNYSIYTGLSVVTFWQIEKNIENAQLDYSASVNSYESQFFSAPVWSSGVR